MNAIEKLLDYLDEMDEFNQYPKVIDWFCANDRGQSDEFEKMINEARAELEELKNDTIKG